MTTEELITKQQLEIEQYKSMLEENKEILKAIKGKLYSIGQPLNDNVLKFNKDQLIWCMGLADIIESINYK